MKCWVFILILMVAGISGFLLSLYIQHQKSAPALKYIQPELVLHNPVSFVSTLKHDPNAGEKIYLQYCSSCHSNNPIIPVNAPTIGNKKAWNKYINWSMKKLLSTADNGIKAMPARGGCFECSDDLIKQAILYMLRKTKVTPAESLDHKPLLSPKKQ